MYTDIKTAQVQANATIETPNTQTTTIQVQPTFSPARIYTDIASNAFGVVLGLGIGGLVIWKIVNYLDLKGLVTSLVERLGTSYTVIQTNSELIKKHSELMDRQQLASDKQQVILDQTTKAIHRIEDMIETLREDLEKSGSLSQHYPSNKKQPRA